MSFVLLLLNLLLIKKSKHYLLPYKSDLMIEDCFNIRKLIKVVKILSSALRGTIEIPIIITSIEVIFANHHFNLAFLRLFLVLNPCKKIMFLGSANKKILGNILLESTRYRCGLYIYEKKKAKIMKYVFFNNSYNRTVFTFESKT